MTQKRYTNGLTLIEMLIVVSIIGIMVAISAPNFRDYTMNAAIKSRVRHFASILQVARSEAIKQKRDVTVCVSSDGATCSGSANWEDGWVVFFTNNLGNDEIIRVGYGFANKYGGTLRTTWTTGQSSISFNQQGTLNNALGRGTFRFCDSRLEEKAHAIILNSVGRTQKAIDTDDPKDKIVNDHMGANISCPLS